jgi:hypothetical protein
MKRTKDGYRAHELELVQATEVDPKYVNRKLYVIDGQPGFWRRTAMHSAGEREKEAMVAWFEGGLVEVCGETHYVPPGLVSLEIKPGETVTFDSLAESMVDAKGGVRGEDVKDWHDADVREAAIDQARSKWADMVSDLKDYVGHHKADDLEAVESIEARECWGAQYSAPGYMDQTDWVLGDTEEEAESECKEMYGDEEEEDDDDEQEGDGDEAASTPPPCPDCGETTTDVSRSGGEFWCPTCELSVKANGSADIEEDDPAFSADPADWPKDQRDAVEVAVREKMALDEAHHVHQWGPVEESRMTGNPHRKCLGCGEVTLDLEGGATGPNPSPYEEVAEESRMTGNPHRKCLGCGEVTLDLEGGATGPNPSPYEEVAE